MTIMWTPSNRNEALIFLWHAVAHVRKAYHSDVVELGSLTVLTEAIRENEYVQVTT